MSLQDLGLLTPTQIISRLRTLAATLYPTLGSRIYGAANYDKADDWSRVEVPSLVVMQADNSGERYPSDQSEQTGTQQRLTRRFDILLTLENSDKRGQEADSTAVAYAQFLIQALVGWSNDENGFCIAYEGDDLYKADKSRYMRVFHFSQRVTFDSNEVSWGDIGDVSSLPWLETIGYTLDNLSEQDITIETGE